MPAASDHLRVYRPIKSGEVHLICYKNKLRGIDRRDTWRARCDEHPVVVLTGKPYEKPWSEVCDGSDCCTDHDKERRRLVEMFKLGRLDAR